MRPTEGGLGEDTGGGEVKAPTGQHLTLDGGDRSPPPMAAKESSSEGRISHHPLPSPLSPPLAKGTQPRGEVMGKRPEAPSLHVLSTFITRYLLPGWQ